MDLLGFVLVAAGIGVTAVTWVAVRDHRLRERPGDEDVAGPAEHAGAGAPGACIAWNGTDGTIGPPTNCGAG